MNRPPTAIAIVTGSFWAALLVVAVAYTPGLWFTIQDSKWSHFPWQFALIFFFALWAGAAVGAATIGLIWHAIAMRRRWTGVFGYLFVGALLGAALPAVLTAPIWISEIESRPPEPFGQAFSMMVTLAGAVMGPLTALFVWLIRRPDRDAPPNPPTSAT